MIESIKPTAPQGENKGKGKAPSLWSNVRLDHLEKLADGLKKYAEKKKAEEAAKKKGKIKIKIFF